MNDPNPTTAWFVFRVVLILSVMPAAIPLIAEQPSAHDQSWSQFRGFHHTGEALEAATPPTTWNSDRPPIRATNVEFKKAYCTPLVIEVEGKRQAIIPGAQWIVAYDPDSGEEVWRADHGKGFSVTPMASYESGLIVFATGYGKPEFVAVDPRGTGDVTNSHVRWRAKNAPAMSSFVGHEGKIISISDRGILNCLDATSGEIVQRKRIGGNFSSSPLLAGGHVYFCSREGIVSVVSLAAGFKTVATNRFEESIMASPAVFKNDLIIRTATKLIRIREEETQGEPAVSDPKN